MGVKIRIAGVGSMNVPTIRIMMFIMIKITYLLPVRARMPLPIRSGMPVKDMPQDMMEERPIMKVMMPVIFADSRMIPGRSDGLMLR